MVCLEAFKISDISSLNCTCTIFQKPKVNKFVSYNSNCQTISQTKDSAWKINQYLLFGEWCTSLYALKAGVCSVITTLPYILNSIKWLYASVSIQNVFQFFLLLLDLFMTVFGFCKTTLSAFTSWLHHRKLMSLPIVDIYWPMYNWTLHLLNVIPIKQNQSLNCIFMTLLFY